jgi:hypothetical protein
VGGNAIDLGDALLPDFIQERLQGCFVQPLLWRRRQSDWWERIGNQTRLEIPDDAEILQTGRFSIDDFNCEKTFVCDVSQSVHHTRPAEVDTRGPRMRDRIETGALAEALLPLVKHLEADCLK